MSTVTGPTTSQSPTQFDPKAKSTIASLCSRIMLAVDPYLCCGVGDPQNIVSVKWTRLAGPSQVTMTPDIDLEQMTKVKLKCAGLTNIAHRRCLEKCYFNALIKALWATPGMHDLVEQKAGEVPPNTMALHLKSIFTALESKDQKGPLAHDQEDIMAILRMVHKEGQFNALGIAQQDAMELFQAIFSHLLFTPDPHMTEEDIEIAKLTSLPKLFDLKERKQRDPPPGSTPMFIPEADFTSSTPDPSTQFIASIPEGALSHDLSKLFSPTTERSAIQFTSVRGNHRNSELTDATIRAEIARLGGTVTYQESKVIVGEPPAFLPVQLRRYFAPKTREGIIEALQKARVGSNQTPLDPSKFEGKSQDELLREFGVPKNLVPVFPPPTLSVPCEGQEKPISYKLSAIVIQRGSSIKEGHYFTYIPDHNSPPQTLDPLDPTNPDDPFRGKELPSRWVWHNDAEVSTVTCAEILPTLARNGYLYLYQRC